MRRLQIYLDETLDDALSREAERRGVSKGAVIRKALARDLGPPHIDAVNPWLALAGRTADAGVGDIDDVIYENAVIRRPDGVRPFPRDPVAEASGALRLPRGLTTDVMRERSRGDDANPTRRLH